MWFSKENLDKDRRILEAPPSMCASLAARVFLAQGKRRILEIASGIGRDTFHLESYGLSVVCAEVSLNGLRVAQQIKLAQGAAFRLTNADARRLPFRDNVFDGAYCFGLLHEFTSETWESDVDHVMQEVNRVLCNQGILAITVLSGDPEKTLPKVRFFTRVMFDHAIRCFHPIQVEEYDDIGCTGRHDYHVWYGLLQKRIVSV